MKNDSFNFYFITDSRLSRKGNVADVKAALDAGARIIQYREKNKSTRAMIQEAQELRRLCIGRAIFLINDRVDVCFAVDADGVHLGQDDMDLLTARRILGNSKIIGVSIHTEDEAFLAQSAGAAYLGLGPIYQTFTKEDAGNALGTEMIRKVRKITTLPIVAIGGITKVNTPDVIMAGANSVAAISATVSSDDVQKEVAEFNRLIKENKE